DFATAWPGSSPGLQQLGYQADNAAVRSADSMVFTNSMVMVMGPTPPGTGVIQPATSETPAKSTSPQSLPSSLRFMPTSITTAPGLTISAVSMLRLPTAATTISAWRVWCARSGVALWQIVTVALAPSSSM